MNLLLRPSPYSRLATCLCTFSVLYSTIIIQKSSKGVAKTAFIEIGGEGYSVKGEKLSNAPPRGGGAALLYIIYNSLLFDSRSILMLMV